MKHNSTSSPASGATTAPGPESGPPTWAGYVRVSSKTQANKRDQNGEVHGTHENQVEALTVWAKRAGVRLELYQDPGVTGKDGENIRGPVFLQMLADLSPRGMAGVVCTEIDRIGREELDLFAVYKSLRNIGKELLSLKEGDMKITAAADDNALLRGVLTVFAAHERRKIRQRMGDGFRRKLAQGWKPGREPKAVNWKDAQRLLDAGASVATVARAFGLSRVQFWRRMQAQGVTNPRSRPFGKPRTSAEKKEDPKC
jgi:DNA invertase Pin-like site-specific DNA recombinase